MDVEDQEGLFHSYQCALYYVQSPSTLSHAYSADHPDYARSHHNNNLDESDKIIHNITTLSRYSSSRGSNNSLFLHEKKGGYDIGGGTVVGNEKNVVIGEKCGLSVHDVVKNVEEYEDEDEDDENFYGGGRRGGGWWWWRKYFSFGTSSSCVWMCMQISWRLLVSLSIALLVFYISTKPPPPKVSIKMARIGEFGLGEGVDATGIPTKILTCNCSIDVVIDNNSKIFGLHINPPLMEMSFAHLPFAVSRGPKLYVKCYESTLFEIYVGTKNTPMYGAGRRMQDMLESGQGLPLLIRVRLRSSFRVVWGIIKPIFHHQAECLVVLNNAYDNKHHTQSYNSTCTITS